jgi:prefoldin subunit 5
VYNCHPISEGLQGDKALDTAVDERDREIETLSTKVTANESLLQKLTSQLEQLKTEEQEKQQKAEEIPTATWQMVM